MLKYLKNIINRFSVYMEDRHTLYELSMSDRKLIRRIRKKRLTYLSVKKLVQIVKTCRSIEKDKISGLFIEAGCALGGSAILIASLKSKERHFYVYDVFEMIPSPTDEDTEDVHNRYSKILEGKSAGIGGDQYYGYQNNLYETVQKNLIKFGINTDRFNVKLIKGLLQNTMKLSEPIALAHIDVDWHDPVKHSLEQIYPKLVLNGSIILDDYYDWGGCRKAVDEFLKNKIDEVLIDQTYGSLKITKIKS